MSIQHQTLAYLTDKAGQVHETLVIRAKKPQEDVERMNDTCRAATDGKFQWTLTQPQQEGAA